jgi:hypothetical protein
MTIRTNLVVVMAAVLGGCCDGDNSSPRERVGEPLAISGESTRDGSASARNDRGGADGSDPEPEPDREGEIDASASPVLRSSAPDLERALELALEADEAGARGDLQAAASGYGRAVAADGSQPWFRVARAWFLARLGRTPQARDDLERTLDQVELGDPLVIAAAHFALGEQQLSRRDGARARESFRMGLRSWAGPPLARAMLSLTPASDGQREELGRLAYGGAVALTDRFGFSQRDLLALAEVDGGPPLAVVAATASVAEDLPVGASYRLIVGAEASPPDGGVARREVILGEASPARWHHATCRSVTLEGGRTLALVTLEVTGPGAGAPSKTTAVVVDIRQGEPLKILSRPVGEEREAPFGCRRGWREELEIEAGSGEGVPTTLRAVRRTFVRQRFELPEGVCDVVDRGAPPQVIPIPSPRREEPAAERPSSR